MNKSLAKKIAERVTNEQLKQMFDRAKTEIVDWTKRSSVNIGMTKGTAWNILAHNFDVNHKYNTVAMTNMIWEFGDYLPDNVVVERTKKKRYPVPVHQEPKFDND